ncbi:MAG: zinc-binding dehydrogenase [Planctomycetes bacterium]|nr:zinc-binding dehydrogenase [Planctomycetota bacterium]
MRAAVIREHGGVEKILLEDRPDPRPRANEVLVAVRACALNHLDLWVRRGVPGHAFPLPLIPGSDMAGEVVEAGELVKNAKPGDRIAVSPGLSCGVCRACLSGRDHQCREYGIFGETRDGGCADLAAVPATNVIPLPPGMEFAAAASVSLVFLTAWHMLVERARVRPGETVLVQAGGSGVGSAAVQIAKLWGATVIATAGGEEKCRRVRELGADHAIDHTKADFLAEVRRITGKRGVDVVVEHVGGETFAKSLKCLDWHGRVVTCGATTGPAVELNLTHVFFRSLSILGSTMGPKGELLEAWQHVAAGRLRPVVDRTFPLSRIRDAHGYLEERKAFGKVVVLPGS